MTEGNEWKADRTQRGGERVTHRYTERGATKHWKMNRKIEKEENQGTKGRKYTQGQIRKGAGQRKRHRREMEYKGMRYRETKKIVYREMQKRG